MMFERLMKGLSITIAIGCFTASAADAETINEKGDQLLAKACYIENRDEVYLLTFYRRAEDGEITFLQSPKTQVQSVPGGLSLHLEKTFLILDDEGTMRGLLDGDLVDTMCSDVTGEVVQASGAIQGSSLGVRDSDGNPVVAVQDLIDNLAIQNQNADFKLKEVEGEYAEAMSEVEKLRAKVETLRGCVVQAQAASYETLKLLREGQSDEIISRRITSTRADIGRKCISN
jgi:hypothetical protein